MDKYKNMSDDKLWECLEAKYGKTWDWTSLDKNDPLVEEYFRRISMGN